MSDLIHITHVINVGNVRVGNPTHPKHTESLSQANLTLAIQGRPYKCMFHLSLVLRA